MMNSTVVRSLQNAQRQLSTSFYRGGTSRGLIFRDLGLAQYSQKDRDKILCAARSPDPDGRQIDGMGAGTSSTSKVAIVHKSGSEVSAIARKYGDAFPGLPWLDEPKKVQDISDIVYRFGQVIIKEERIDWGSTCGNMVAAAAHFAISRLFAKKPDQIPRASDAGPNEIHNWPVRLLAHDTGKVVIAQVPVAKKVANSSGAEIWAPVTAGSTSIAGVPGTAPGILIESPLAGSILPTGNERDLIDIDGNQVEVSIVDTGLPVVIVSAQALDIPLSQLLEHPLKIESNAQLMQTLEQVRQKACSLTPALQATFSTPSPKLCVIVPRCAYRTTGGEHLTEDTMDLLVRVVSSGQLHRTIPATTLSALAAARSFADSIVGEMTSDDSCPTTKMAESKFANFSSSTSGTLQSITVGQPAGLSTASVRLDPSGKPISTLMMRTAHEIMNGTIAHPPMPVNSQVLDALRQIQARRAKSNRRMNSGSNTFSISEQGHANRRPQGQS